MAINSQSSRNVHGGPGGLPLEIPLDTKKIVQNLREVVGKNCADSEIYAILVDCNMDANDAVQRLLSQDTFREVKSKRERRKEMKETLQLRAARSNSGTSNRGARLDSDGSSYIASTENNHKELGKAAYKREIGSSIPLVSSSPSNVYHATGKNINDQPSTISNFFNADNRRQSIGTGDTISSSVQLSLGLQPAWPGVSKGHISMADIVRRGRPENRGSEMSTEIPYMPQLAVSTNSSHSCIKSLEASSPPESMMHQGIYSFHPSNLSEMIHESDMTANQRDVDNEWPEIENLTSASGSSALFTSADPNTEVYDNPSCLNGDMAKLSTNSQSNKVQVSERDIDIQNLNSSNGSSSSASTRQIFANGAGEASDDDLLPEKSTHDSLWHKSKTQEGMASTSDLPFPNQAASVNSDIALAVSSAAAHLQQLRIGKEGLAMPPPENNSTLVLPNYLQTFASDCSHLSFGTYKSGAASASPQLVASNPLTSNLEFSAAVDGSSAMHLNMRNSGYLVDEHRSFLYGSPTTADVRDSDLLVSSQAEAKAQDAPESTCGHPNISPLSLPDSSIKNIQQSSHKSSFGITPYARNLPTLQSEMNNHSTRDSGIGSQTMLFQEAAYYRSLGQNPQHAGYKHGQLASHHYESLGYPSIYPSQMDYTKTSAANPW